MSTSRLFFISSELTTFSLKPHGIQAVSAVSLIILWPTCAMDFMACWVLHIFVDHIGAPSGRL